MTKILVGLDMSITSTGLCIDNNGIKDLVLFVDKELSTNKKCDQITYINYQRILLDNPDFKDVDDEMIKLLSYERLASCILKYLLGYIYTYDVTETYIYFEKPSLASKGQAMLEIPIVNAIIRNKLLTEFSYKNIKGHTPSSLKKLWTGKGNANKEAMELEYNKRTNLPKLERKIKGCKLDDIIDAIALVEINK